MGYSDGKNIPGAVAIAEAADAVVLVVGLTSEGSSSDEGPRDEAEGHDRYGVDAFSIRSRLLLANLKGIDLAARRCCCRGRSRS